MSVEIFVVCDGDNCNSRVQVPQQGAIPQGWVVLSWVQPDFSINGPVPQEPRVKQISKLFCGWRCAHKLVKGYIREKDIVG